MEIEILKRASAYFARENGARTAILPGMKLSIAVTLMLTAFLLVGCSEEKKVAEGAATSDVDYSDPCSLLSGEDVAAALGVDDLGPATVSAANPTQTDDPHCAWTLPEGGGERLGLVTSYAGTAVGEDEADVGVVSGAYSADSECWGLDCSSASAFVDSWLAGNVSSLGGERIPGMNAAVSGTSAVYSPRDFVDLQVTVYRCNSEQCVQGARTLIEFLAD